MVVSWYLGISSWCCRRRLNEKVALVFECFTREHDISLLLLATGRDVTIPPTYDVM
jgi:hypothetical protein